LDSIPDKEPDKEPLETRQLKRWRSLLKVAALIHPPVTDAREALFSSAAENL
jgi:hypothetical protein